MYIPWLLNKATIILVQKLNLAYLLKNEHTRNTSRRRQNRYIACPDVNVKGENDTTATDVSRNQRSYTVKCSCAKVLKYKCTVRHRDNAFLLTYPD